MCLSLLLGELRNFFCIYGSLSSRYLYRRNKKGITAKLDDDLLKFYCNEDTFLMQVRKKKRKQVDLGLWSFQVTAIELEGAEGQESIMYDITLCELPE